MNALDVFYVAGLATLAGYLLIGRVPSILFTPMLAGASFAHGIVLVGALLLLGAAEDLTMRVIGTLAVMAATVNVVGGFIVMRRLFLVHQRSGKRQTDKGDPGEPSS